MSCGLFLHRRAAATPAHRARIRRIRNRPARNGMGRNFSISIGTDPETRGNGPAGRDFSRRIRRRGLGYVEYATVIEELSRVDGSIGLIVAAHNSLCTNHIYKFGTPEQRKKYVTPLAQGKKLGCWSLTEPQAGSDAGGARTTAARKDGGWVLNGSKTFITNGHYADVCVAMAVTDKPKGTKGISAFIVEKGNSGFSRRQKRKQAGHARERYFRSHFQRLPRSGRESARQGRPGLREYFAGAGWRTNFHCRAGARNGARRLRSGGCSTPSKESNLEKRSANFRPFNSSWPTWPPKSTPRAGWCTARHGSRTKKARASRKNPAWQNCTPAKWACAWPTKPCRFSAATDS